MFGYIYILAHDKLYLPATTLLDGIYSLSAGTLIETLPLERNQVHKYCRKPLNIFMGSSQRIYITNRTEMFLLYALRKVNNRKSVKG